MILMMIHFLERLVFFALCVCFPLSLQTCIKRVKRSYQNFWSHTILIKDIVHYPIMFQSINMNFLLLLDVGKEKVFAGGWETAIYF